MNIIAIFSNRTDTMFFYKVLQSNKIPSQIINTPNRARFSCSVSVKFSSSYINLAAKVIKKYNLSSFIRFANYF